MTKIYLISVFVILFLVPQLIFSQEEIDFVTLNDSTVFCSKNDTNFLLQFRNGKIVDKQNFLSFFNVEEIEDTLQWNGVIENVIENKIIPDVSVYVLYDTINNPDDSFNWYIKNQNEIRRVNSYKSTNETNLFKVDSLIYFIAGKELKSTDDLYKSILKSIANYSEQTMVWKNVRDSLRRKLNKEKYNYRLTTFIDESGDEKTIFIQKITKRDELPIYNKLTPKTFELQQQADIKENGPSLYKRFPYSFLSGALVVLVLLVILYLLFKKKISVLLISKKSLRHIKSMLPILLENRESILKPYFDKLYDEFTLKFGIYNDVSDKLKLQKIEVNDKDKAFQLFIESELKDLLYDKTNIKELLITDNIPELKKRLSEVESIFEELSNLENFDFDKNKQTDLPEKVKTLIDKISSAESTFKIIADIKELDFNKEEEKHTVLPSIIQKLIDKISSNKEKIETLKKDRDRKQTRLTDVEKEKSKLESDLLSKNNNIKRYEKFHTQLQNNINTIRRLDKLFERKGANSKNSKDDKNNIIFATLQLRSLLNLFYCSLSENNEQYQINNLRSLNKDNDKDINTLLDEIENIKKNSDLNFDIEKGDYNNSSTLYQNYIRIFNKDLDSLPKPYYFGIEADKHNKSKN